MKHFGEKKVMVIANVFPKLKAVKDFVKPLSEKSLFGTPFDSQHGKGSQIFVKSAWEHSYQIFLSLWGNLISKMSPLVRGEILGAFVSKLTVDEKYRLRNCGNLLLLIHNYKNAIITKNKKEPFLNYLFNFCNIHQILDILEKGMIVITFCHFFVPFLKHTSNFKHFETKHDCHN